jgi:hypothetical protein
MSFGEFIFFAGFIQKTTEEDLNIKRDHGIISSRIHRKVLEDTRGLHAEGGDRPYQVGLASPAMPPGTPYGKPPQASRVFFHHLLGCISAIREVGLI